MSLSNGADSKQQKLQLSNPFDLADSEIFEKVYLTHLNDDYKCDVEVLYEIVSSVILKDFGEREDGENEGAFKNRDRVEKMMEHLKKEGGENKETFKERDRTYKGAFKEKERDTKDEVDFKERGKELSGRENKGGFKAREIEKNTAP
ncbi:hypothetical protein VNO78_21981 [Psophocarpus tetragonolobus]|uniref:Uncharacterized protein n=1 Tax=Psophocarpus tetragonolobus TaxID=3891 RepID=A0AAN9SE39_PSOTE